MKNSLKRVLAAGSILLLIQFVMSYIFSAERIFLDGTYYIFYVIQFENFHIEHQRFILAVAQLLPVIGTRLGLSLSGILVLNSLNPILYLSVLFYLSIFWLRNEAIAWTLLLSSVCGIYFIWFCPMYEVWYGSTLLIFFAGILEKEIYHSLTEKIFFGLLLITLLFSYPLVCIGVVYFTAAHFLRRKINLLTAILYLSVFAFWIIWKSIFISDYEDGKIEYPLSQLRNIVIENFGTIKGISTFFIFLFKIYTEEFLFFIAAVIYFIIRKEKKQALILVIFVGAYLCLIGFTQSEPWKHSNYFERMYLQLVPICFVAFNSNAFRSLNFKIVLELCFIVIIGTRLFQIYLHAENYVTHSNEVNQVVSKALENSGSKFTIDYNSQHELQTLDEWSLPMETLISSSIKNKNRSITISWKSDIESREIAGKLNENNFRLRLNEIFDDRWLNPNYFNLEKGNYKPLN